MASLAHESWNGLVEYTLPPYCHWQEPYILAYLVPPALLITQAALLLHSAPDNGTTTPRFWLLRRHAQPLRFLLLALVVISSMHMAFALHIAERALPGIKDPSFTANMNNYIVAITGAVAISKSIELAWLSEAPRLRAAPASTPSPYCFPNTWVPLAFDLVFNLSGYGWEWGSKPTSPARYVTPYPPKSRFSPQSRRWFLRRLRCMLGCLAYACFTPFLILQPRTLAAFDWPPGTGAFEQEAYAHSGVARFLARGALTIITGGIGMWAIFVGYFSLASIVHFILDPRAQLYWDPLPFGNPLRATSLHQFWAREWHAIMRRVWYFNGYLPMHCISTRLLRLNRRFARALAVLATFALSGFFHELGLYAMRRGVGPTSNLTTLPSSSPCPPLDPARPGFGANSFVTLRFFLSQAVALILEDIWRTMTGKRVGGILGWLWVLVWLLSAGDMFQVSINRVTLRTMHQRWQFNVTSLLSYTSQTWVAHGFLEPFLLFPKMQDSPLMFAVAGMALSPLYALFDILARIFP